MSRPKEPTAFDHAKLLEGLPDRELDVDWLAVDRDGHFAIFLGSDESMAAGAHSPARGDPEATTFAIDEIGRVTALRRAADLADAEVAGYRASIVRPGEPVFEVPLAAPGSALHEESFVGYPHLFTADPNDGDRAAELRQVMESMGGTEFVVRDAFGIGLLEPPAELYASIHAQRICTGCMALEDPNDPRPRSVEALAAAGLFVYRFGGDAWIRAASPSVPVSLDALHALTEQRLDPARFTFCFDVTRIARL